jgi:hypothetical protein
MFQLNSTQRQNSVTILLNYLEDRRLSEHELDQVHEYNSKSYFDHVAGVSSGIVTVLLAKKYIPPSRFKLITPPLAGLVIVGAYSLVSNFRTDKLLLSLAEASATTALARRLRRNLDSYIFLLFKPIKHRKFYNRICFKTKLIYGDLIY